MGQSIYERKIGPDYLNFAELKEIKQLLRKDEKIIYSCIMKKKNKYGMWQIRNLVLTNMRICNFAELSLKRSIELRTLRALTKTTKINTWKLLLHVHDDYDYKIRTERREELIEHIQG